MPKLFLMMASLACLLMAAPAAAAGRTESVNFPAYDTIRGIDDYASPTEYRAAVADRRFVMEKISYASDGLTVYAYVYRPRSGSRKLPVIIFNRGSWTWPTFSGELVTMANRLARKGYLVVAPMYRGSGGAAGRDELGGAELDDLFNLLPVIKRMKMADTSHLYLYGESRGGMMVYQALRDGFPAKAAAVVGAFTDLDAMLQDPRWAKAGEAIWPDLKSQRSAIVKRRSAVQWADRIGKPVLIIHGAKDSEVSVTQSLDMARQLSALGKHFQLLVVEGEGHTIAGRAADRDAWAMDWFARH